MKFLLYDWGGLNVALFEMINGANARWLDQLMLAGSWLGSHQNLGLFAAAFALAACLRSSSEPGNSVVARSWLFTLAVFAVAYVLDAVLISALKSWFDFPRPLLALPGGSVNIVGEAEYYHSLPSGHAAFAMLVAASIWPRLGRVGHVVAVLGVAWVCLSRIYLGAHFPADVVFGMLISVLVVVVVSRLLKTIFPSLAPTPS